ncbi:MAG TPA: PQQ-dependent sugar dehydrogenase [Blastocatellia bacterium]|jgi:glucose/arabinose dehydrogenase|nr:PQQ-dependent sugar dehydrogenase [Blastocatellia bacterium]
MGNLINTAKILRRLFSNRNYSNLFLAVCLLALPLLVMPTSQTSGSTFANRPPAVPVIQEPATDGQVVNPFDVHMVTAPFSDPDSVDTHLCSDWEIWSASTSQRVWRASCATGNLRVHIHFGDGLFEGPLAGRHELDFDTIYQLRVRHRDSSGDPATEWSPWAMRNFRTSTPPPSGGTMAWTPRQSGFQVDVFATGFQLPVHIAFLPNPGPNTSDPFFYVTELYGNIKVVTRSGVVSDYATGLLNFNPTGSFPGSGEIGLAGITVDPVSGDVFASMMYRNNDGYFLAKVDRFHSNHGGLAADTRQTILDMSNAPQGASHQVSNLSIGADGKLYVHMGDGDMPAVAQNLNDFRGKILRVNLDGSAPADNPFYNAADGITARDYIYAYGFRNPFGGAWRSVDNALYEVENGPSVDRFARVVPGRNYGYTGADPSMSIFAIYNWSPSVAPVALAFVQQSRFNGSGFPSSKFNHAFVTESGPTWATGPQPHGKRISEFVIDNSGNLVSGPMPLLEYTGTGKATAAGIAAGPDGLYFSDLYKDLNYTSPTDHGANILRVKWTGTPVNNPPSVSITGPGGGANFPPGTNITINAAASDSDGSVTKVEFFQGTNKIGEDTTSPYSYTWNSVPPGNYSLTARATDNQGALTTSAPVNLTVQSSTPPPSSDVVLYAADALVRQGNWNVISDATAADGRAMFNPDLTTPKRSTASASPADYFEMNFIAQSDTPYRIWIRGRAQNDFWGNDSVFVQFAGSVDASGNAIWRVGTTSAADVNLEGCLGCGEQGWGWEDNGWGAPGALGPLVYFASSGAQTLRIQTREDGFEIDQIVLSPVTYLNLPPGADRNDNTILPRSIQADVILWTVDVPMSSIFGNWQRLNDSSAAGQAALWNRDRGMGKIATPLANPADYFEVSFNAMAGRPYHLWIRGRAQNDYYGNDSVHVQFSGSVSPGGTPVWRIGSTSAAWVVIEDCYDGGNQSWGWNDDGWCGFGTSVFFETTGVQKIRVQAREDGIIIDQVVISSNAFLNRSPGALKNDVVILPRSD